MTARTTTDTAEQHRDDFLESIRDGLGGGMLDAVLHEYADARLAGTSTSAAMRHICECIEGEWECSAPGYFEALDAEWAAGPRTEGARRAFIKAHGYDPTDDDGDDVMLTPPEDIATLERDTVAYRPVANETFVWEALDKDGATLGYIEKCTDDVVEFARIADAWPDVAWTS